MAAKCLVVDAGHTRVKFAACRNPGAGQLPVIEQSIAVLYSDPIDWATISSWFVGEKSVPAVVVGTNLEKARQVIAAWPSDLWTPRLFTDKLSLPLTIQVDYPEKVGIDRLLNAIAANILRAPDQPAITVGTGTAITVDAIDVNGVFQGGAILPGILLGAKSLHEETTTLPHVDVWELLKREPAVIGKNTESAIASGLYWGHLGAVREMISRLTEVLMNDSTLPPLVLLTGGASGILAPYLPEARLENELPMRGLAAIADQIQSS